VPGEPAGGHGDGLVPEAGAGRVVVSGTIVSRFRPGMVSNVGFTTSGGQNTSVPAATTNTG
jgi:hypothetical protein